MGVVTNWTQRCRRWWHRRGEMSQARTLRQQNVGPRSVIDPTAQVLGWRHVRIGHHTMVSAETWINANNRAAMDEIVIGNNCFVGRRNFLNAGASLILGDYCLTGPDCHFLGADHLINSPFSPYATAGATRDGVIEVGPNCWFGSTVIVLKNVRIGFGSVLGAGAVITRDVPPFSMAVGSPARVIKRFDVKRAAWVRVEDFPLDGESFFPSAENYLATLQSQFPSIKGPRQAMGAGYGDC